MYNTGASILTRLINQYEAAQTNVARCAAVSLLMWEYQPNIAQFRQQLIASGDYEQLASLDEMVDSYRRIKPRARVHYDYSKVKK